MRISIKLFVVTGLLVLGWRMDGSWKGAAAMAIVLFVGWFVYLIVTYDSRMAERAAMQAPQRTKQIVSEFQATADFKERVEGPSRRGMRLNPDPTRPTEDDYAALITTIIERNR